MLDVSVVCIWPIYLLIMTLYIVLTERYLIWDVSSYFVSPFEICASGQKVECVVEWQYSSYK